MSVAFGADSCADHAFVVAFQTRRHFRGGENRVGGEIRGKDQCTNGNVVLGLFIAEVECSVGP